MSSLQKVPIIKFQKPNKFQYSYNELVSKIDFFVFGACLLFGFCYLVIHLISAICKNLSFVEDRTKQSDIIHVSSS